VNLLERLIVLAFLATSQTDAASLVSPVAAPFSSGPAFPLGRNNRNAPDPQYAADKAIDGDPATFCCLMDDTLGAKNARTIPANAVAPVTGHIIFDLGKPVVVIGAKLIARGGGGAYVPKSVDFFYFADDDPSNNALVDDVENDSDLMPLAKHTYRALGNGSSQTVTWNGVVARYVGLRVNSSYETAPVHYNFQIGEIQFIAGPKPPGVASGTRLPSIYVKKGTLQGALLATREHYARWFPQSRSPRDAPLHSSGLSDKLW